MAAAESPPHYSWSCERHSRRYYPSRCILWGQQRIRNSLKCIFKRCPSHINGENLICLLRWQMQMHLSDIKYEWVLKLIWEYPNLYTFIFFFLLLSHPLVASVVNGRNQKKLKSYTHNWAILYVCLCETELQWRWRFFQVVLHWTSMRNNIYNKTQLTCKNSALAFSTQQF